MPEVTDMSKNMKRKFSHYVKKDFRGRKIAEQIRG